MGIPSYAIFIMPESWRDVGRKQVIWRHSLFNISYGSYLFNSLFRLKILKSKKILKLHITGLGERCCRLSSHRTSNAESVSMSWRHHVCMIFWPFQGVMLFLDVNGAAIMGFVLSDSVAVFEIGCQPMNSSNTYPVTTTLTDIFFCQVISINCKIIDCIYFYFDQVFTYQATLS